MPCLPRYPIIFLFVMLLLLPGCYNKPVRHLASDASLITVGSSTRNDVLTYLGEPDGQRPLPGGGEEWIYVEERAADLQRIPLMGRYFDSEAKETIVVVLENDIVQSCQYREFGKDELDWADDYSWQEKEE